MGSRPAEGSAVNDVEYELLAWLEGGHTIFRPVEGTASAKLEFQDTVARLLELRERGLVQFADGRIGRTEAGEYLMVGPCDLTPAGRSALERDRRLGPRPPSSSRRVP
jgi:hypothetical protein